MGELKTAQLTAADIQARLARRAPRLPTAIAPDTPPGPTRRRYRATVALLGWFDVTTLETGLGPLDRSAITGLLVEDCERVLTPRGHRWRLQAALRDDAIRGMGSVEATLAALASTAADPDDATRAMAEAYLRGTAPDVTEQTTAQLYGTLQVIEPLAPFGVPLPAPQDVRDCAAAAAVLDPLRTLVPERFVGRIRELAELRRYVAGQERQPWRLVHGPGGVGKSTLVAQLVLGDADTPVVQRTRVTYLSFDRTDLIAGRPLTLLAEAVRQFGLLNPSKREEAAAVERSIQAVVRRAAAEDRSERPESKAVRASPADAEHDETVLIGRYARLVASPGGTGLPLLWMLDTFELAQRRGPHGVDRLLNFLAQLSQAVPALRLVIVGRAALGGSYTQSLALTGLDDDQAVTLLRHTVGELHFDDAFLREVIGQVSTNPLSLKLAGELLRKEGAEGLPELAERRVLLARLAAEEVQGILYRRILDRLGDEDLQRIANPGLAVRRITPDVIMHVLARPCGLRDVDHERSSVLFQMLRDEASLVDVVPGEEAVVHRADVRRAMLPLLRRNDPAAVRAIHRQAVRYYHHRTGIAARVEEQYHRLALDQRKRTLDRWWDQEAAPLLASALDELPAAAVAYLADKLRIPVDAETRRHAEDEIWASQAVRAGRELLDAGRADEALNVLLERDTGKVEVVTVAADALAATGRLGDALDLVVRTLGDGSGGGPADLIQLLLLGARIAEDAARYDDALRWAGQARTLADTAALPMDRLAAAIVEVRIHRRTGRADTHDARALRAWLVEAADRFEEQDRYRDPALVRDLAAEVGDEVPSLVLDAARLHGVNLQGPSGGVLAETFGDQAVYEVASGAQPTGWSAAGMSEPLTVGEVGTNISVYLEEPEHVADWAGPLSDAYKAEVDQPTYQEGQ